MWIFIVFGIHVYSVDRVLINGNLIGEAEEYGVRKGKDCQLKMPLYTHR